MATIRVGLKGDGLDSIQRLAESQVGKVIVSRTLTKAAKSGKTEGRRKVLEVWAVRSDKIKLYVKPARKEKLEATIGIVSSDQRGKKGIPLHDFKVKWRPGKKKYRAGSPPSLTAEVLRGTRTAWEGGFLVKAGSGKTVAVRRLKGVKRDTATGEWPRPWSKTLLGPSPGAMFTNKRVVGPLLDRIRERVSVILEQETNFAMNVEKRTAPEDTQEEMD